MAQPSSLFETITTANGLPSNYVFCVAEDSEGYMWAGTDKGLCRYNGSKWEVWDIDNGLPGNYINSITADKNGGLWLGIAEKDLYWFNIHSHQIISLPINPNGAKQHPVSLYIDGTACMVLDNNQTGQEETYALTVDTAARKISTNLLFTLNRNDYKVHCRIFPGKKEQWLFIYKDSKPERIKTLPGYKVKLLAMPTVLYNYRVFVEKNVALSDNFFAYYNEAGTHMIYSGSLFGEGSYLLSVCFAAGKYMGANLGDGFVVIDSNGAIKRFSEKNGLSSNMVNSLYVDKNNNTYICTLGGGINVLEATPGYRLQTGNIPIRRLLHSGSFFYALSNKSVFQFDETGIKNNFVLPHKLLSFYITHDTLITNSFTELSFYKIKTASLQKINSIPFTTGVSSILPYKKGWLLATFGRGFHYADTKSIVPATDPKKIPFNNIEKAIALKNGFAALSYEDGFYITDTAFKLQTHFTSKGGLASNYVSTVYEINDSLWVGGKKSVTLIVNNQVVKTFTASDGLRGTYVKEINRLANGLLTIATDEYIHYMFAGKLQPVKSTGIGLGKSAKASEVLSIPGLAKFCVASDEGILLLDVEGILPAENGQIPKISAILMAGVPITGENLQVPYNFRNLEFRFAPISSLLLKRTALFYSINNKDWLPISDTLTVSFANLRSGQYQLWVKTLDTDGFESGPIMLKSFVVQKPWWQAWWFFAATMLTGSSLLWLLFLYIGKRKYKKKLQLQQQLDNERQRISRDLHDNMGAYTSALIANVQQLKNKVGENADTKKMESNAAHILNSLRETIWVLNNKEISVQELSDGFKNYCFKLLQNFEHISFNATEAISGNNQIQATRAVHLNKIMQEAVQNIIKHSAASSIGYSIKDGNGLEITISDNGIGFVNQQTKAGYGLSNMQWRAKEAGLAVNIESGAGKGTVVTINTPK